MPFLSKKTTVAWIGITMMFIGVVLMLIWGLMSLGNGDESSLPLTPYAPTPTKKPDLLIPTRTPTVTVAVSSGEDEQTPTLTQTQNVSPPDTQPSATPTTALKTDDNTKTTPALLPTKTSSNSTPTLMPTATETIVPGTDSPSPGTFQIPRTDIFRIGVSLPHGVHRDYDLVTLGVGWVMDWNTYINPPLPPGIEFVQTVRMMNGILKPDVATLTSTAGSHPGSTWLMSNEPDVRWQDNITPETYARLYHDAYHAIKSSDPTAIVAAGGIAQPSQLRFEYLDLVLEAYRSTYGVPMPLQAWQIHNYMLREERDTWGVDIPPGISAQQGVLYSIDDTGNLAAFKSQIYDFRRWMANRGYVDLPLIVSEFGIPMPPDYGFDVPRVSEFLRETWYFFYTATDPAIGNPADGGRLVQRWCWFSLGVAPYPSGNLLYPPDGDWTPLAYVWRDMVEK